MLRADPLLLSYRAKPLGQHHVLLWGLGLMLSLLLGLLGIEQASYALSPHVRAAHLSIKLEDPLPLIAAPKQPTPPPSDAPSDGAAVATLPSIEPPLSLASAFDQGAPAPAYRLALKPEDRRRAERCLTDAIYYEAASESEDGQRAIAQVVLNRLRHPAWPKTVCGVVYQGSDLPGCQFSYACDGSLQRAPAPLIWARIAHIARAALDGAVFAPVGMATHYHTWRVNPLWNRGLIITAVLGNHIFYRLPGTDGLPSAFTLAHRGPEPLPGPLRWRALATKAPPLPADTKPQSPQFALAAPAPFVQFSATDADQYVPGALPQSEILPRFRQSGSWRTH